MVGNTVVLNDSNFNEFINSTSGLIVVFFWTLWCGHCGPVMRVFVELSEEVVDTVFVLVNKDEGEETAKEYGALSVPFLAFMKEGKAVHIHRGGILKDQLRGIIDNLK